MSWVFENGPSDPSERLILLALADYAADNGEWAPSMIGIASKAGMTERGARGVIRRLEAGGWIETQVGGGRGGKSRYRVIMKRPENPEQETRNDKPGMTNPEYGDAKPGTKRPKTRNQRSAEPSEPSLPSEEPPLVPPPISDAPTEKPEPKARLPSNWVLSDEGWAYARSQHIPDEVIHDEARGFHAYWSDRRDRDASKSARGWAATWEGWCRRIAGRYAARGGMAGKAATGGYGQGGSIASIAARRRATGQV